MAIVTRKSALAVKVETTEGTPVAPTASTDYLPIQDDVDFSAEFDVLENAELKNSIGRSKPVLGAENPTASFGLYLKHSGTQGQAPAYRQILKAAWGGEDVETLQSSVLSATVAAATTQVGEGTRFVRGQAALIKDGVNGYSIRAIDSISGDVLTYGFNTASAATANSLLGLAATYFPVDEGQQTLSLWNYVGNGGAVQLVSGCRPTSITYDFPAGDFINGAYSFEGIEYFFNPVTVTATNKFIDFNDDDGTQVATIVEGTYKDPHSFAAAVLAAFDAASNYNFEVNYQDADGKYYIVSDSATLELLFNTGANTANSAAAILGFSTAADETGDVEYTSTNAIDLTSPQSPSFDDSDPLVAKANEVMIGDADDNACFQASNVSFSLATPRRTIDSVCAVSGRSGSIVQSREVEVTVTALLEQYDADKFRRFRENTQTRFQYSFGVKQGGNWIPGRCGALYLPTATITSFDVSDDDGLVSLEMTLQAYVDSQGQGECYLSFV